MTHTDVLEVSAAGITAIFRELGGMMMSNQVQGVVESKSRKGDSIKVGGEWYSSWQGKGLESVQAGHNVSLQYALDKTGRYRNIKSVTITGGAPKYGASGATTGASTATKPFSNIGVELGHASKLAMDVCLNIKGLAVGSPEFYKAWVQHTDKIFTAMHKLRELKSKEETAPPITESTPVVEMEEEPSATSTEISLF